jgi:hypothetical protein
LSFRRTVIAGQGIYYVLTGLWPLVSMETFEKVTGEKTDDWLVYMVGLLAFVIGTVLLAGVRRATPSLETVMLAVFSTFAFASIDTVFALNGTISRIYLADAVVEVVFFLLIVGGLRWGGKRT